MLLEKLIYDKLAETNIWFGEKQSTQNKRQYMWLMTYNLN